ncbi:Uncharacterised protein [uncultured Eubacterium sp.]|nr:Uncharacterised protein [uncultured Eubacterium sp.]
MKRKHIIIICVLFVVCLLGILNFANYRENKAKEAYNECAMAAKEAYYEFYHEATAVIEGNPVTYREITASYVSLQIELNGWARPFYEFASESKLPFTDKSGVRDESSTIVDLYLRIESLYYDIGEAYFLNGIPGNSKKTGAQLKKILGDTKDDIDLICRTFD